MCQTFAWYNSGVATNLDSSLKLENQSPKRSGAKGGLGGAATYPQQSAAPARIVVLSAKPRMFVCPACACRMQNRQPLSRTPATSQMIRGQDCQEKVTWRTVALIFSIQRLSLRQVIEQSSPHEFEAWRACGYAYVKARRRAMKLCTCQMELGGGLGSPKPR